MNSTTTASPATMQDTLATTPMNTGAPEDNGKPQGEGEEASRASTFEPLPSSTLEEVVDALLASDTPAELYEECKNIVEAVGGCTGDDEVLRVAKNKLADDPVRLCAFLESLDICFGIDCWGNVYKVAGIDALCLVLEGSCCYGGRTADVVTLCSLVQPQDLRRAFASLAKMGPESVSEAVSELIDNSYEQGQTLLTPDQLLAILGGMSGAELPEDEVSQLVLGQETLSNLVCGAIADYDRETMARFLAGLVNCHGLFATPKKTHDRDTMVTGILYIAADHFMAFEMTDKELAKHIIAALVPLVSAELFQVPSKVSSLLRLFPNHQMFLDAVCEACGVDLEALVGRLEPEKQAKFAKALGDSKKRPREPEDDEEQFKRHKPLPSDE